MAVVRARASSRIFAVRTMAWMGVLIAVSFLLMLFIEFPIPGFPGHLKYSPADVPALIGTFALGPLAGVIIQAGKCVLYFLSGKGEPIGITANFVYGASWVLAAGLVYRYKRTLTGALLALLVGAAVSLAIMIPANYYVFFPLYGVPTPATFVVLLSMVVPFNVMKFAISSILTFVLYKRVRRWL